MSILAAVIAQQGNIFVDGDPLNYGGLLRQYLDAAVGVTVLGEKDVTRWDDRDTGNGFTVPSGGSSPAFIEHSQNGLPGVDFDENPSVDGILSRKLVSNASAVDNHFNQGSAASITFAGRLNKLTDSNFHLSNTLCTKGYLQGDGWEWVIEPNGSMEFRQRRSNGSTWKIRASGFYHVGDLVLATITYNGGNASNSGKLRLYNNGIDQFVTTGTVTVGSASGAGDDSEEQLVIGNVFDDHDPHVHSPFQGPIFGIWFTRPTQTFIDENYLRRWIPD